MSSVGVKSTFSDLRLGIRPHLHMSVGEIGVWGGGGDVKIRFNDKKGMRARTRCNACFLNPLPPTRPTCPGRLMSSKKRWYPPPPSLTRSLIDSRSTGGWVREASGSSIGDVAKAPRSFGDGNPSINYKVTRRSHWGGLTVTFHSN